MHSFISFIILTLYYRISIGNHETKALPTFLAAKIQKIQKFTKKKSKKKHIFYIK